jgi:hypothetical protein
MATRIVHPFLAQQVQLNQGTADNWELFTSHRQQITNLILSNWEGAGGRLCVLGAGNCNDIDLTALTHRFTESHVPSHAMPVALALSGHNPEFGDSGLMPVFDLAQDRFEILAD